MKTGRRTAEDSGIGLLTYLEGLRLAELQAIYMFWVGADPVPDTTKALIQRLDRRMRNTESVRAGLKLFTRTQRDVLVAVAAADGHAVDKAQFLKGGLAGDAQPYESEAAAQVLLKRGFLAEIPPGAGRPARYGVPRELGALVGRIHGGAPRAPRTLFRLAGAIEGLKTDALALRLGRLVPGSTAGPRRADLTAALLDPAAICARVAGLEDRKLRTLVRNVASQFGGLLSRTLFQRVRSGSEAWDLEATREALETAALGTAGRLDLECYGVALSEETIIVHAEVVDAIITAARPVPAARMRRVNLGADILSDVDRMLAFMGRETVRITQERAIYKTVRRRLRETLITREVGKLTHDKVLDFLIDFTREQAFFAARGNVIRPTRDGMLFTQLGVEAQMRRLVRHVLSTFPVDAGTFHHRPLLTLFLEAFRALEPDRWLDPMELPFRARNAYLAELDDRAVKDAYGRRFEYAMDPPREDPYQMAWRLFDLLTEWFLLLGLVEAAVEGDRLRAIRVTALGRRMLGPQEAAGTDTRKSKRKSVAKPKPKPTADLIVTPDFEVLVHPGPEALEAVHFLDRFAERLHADHHTHFRIDRERFQDLVGRGTRVERILEFLSANARIPLPENVTVTLRDWGAAVRYVNACQVLLLESPDPEVLDRIEKAKETAAAVFRRLSPKVLALDAQKVSADLVEQLRGIGVFVR